MGSATTQKLPVLEAWSIPLLDRIPILGEILFQQNPLFYISYAIAVLLTFIFLKTTWGWPSGLEENVHVPSILPESMFLGLDTYVV